MPRRPAHTAESLLDSALSQFWTGGFYATSMDDLVRATGVSRHGIYGSFGGKQDLFLACFARYQDQVVTPAFAVVEAPEADLAAVSDYFEHQIGRAEAAGLPGPGCFVANAATEVAPHDDAVRAQVAWHNDRLFAGFRKVLARRQKLALSDSALDDIAWVMVVFTNGLWSASRVTKNGAALRRSAEVFLACIEEKTS